MRKIRINATGCCLVDKIYKNVSFDSPGFKKLLPFKVGDGGLAPGSLVFRKDLEDYMACDLESLLTEIIPDKSDFEQNIGGPAIVALISASTLLSPEIFKLAFFQQYGRDPNGAFLYSAIKKAAPCLDLNHYVQGNGPTPSTLVLSDPAYNNGKGERSFINTIGTAGDFIGQTLNDDFFEADIILFGATALTPGIHSTLEKLLCKAQERDAFTIVATVYDFLSEKNNPESPWPLGSDESSYERIDLLVCDHTEALKLTGARTSEQAVIRFKEMELSALVITEGAESVIFYVDPESSRFKPCGLEEIPVCLIDDYPERSKGDTTGCGDNFSGGILASIAMQLADEKERIDLKKAVLSGICAGAAACFHTGGV